MTSQRSSVFILLIFAVGYVQSFCISPSVSKVIQQAKLGESSYQFRLPKESTSSSFSQKRRPSRNFLLNLKSTLNEPNDSRDDFSSSKIIKQTVIMSLCGAALGPFLDGYHSAFGVLQYETPLDLMVGGLRLLQSDYWVPPMFGLAAIILGLSYPYLDSALNVAQANREPSVPKVLTCIAYFSLQYYLSGYMSLMAASTFQLHSVLAATAVANWALFDGTVTGIIMSIITGLAGPVVEIGLLNFAPAIVGHPLYHYTLPDVLGIPLWIGWVYACGAPAVGNLARLFWQLK